MTGKQRMLATMEGRRTDIPAASIYISWPEYGWRLTRRPVWEVVLGENDGLELWDSVLRRHAGDMAPGPVGMMGTGWLRDKVFEGADRRYAHFRSVATDERWLFDIESHALLKVDADGRVVSGTPHPGDGSAVHEPPTTIPEAEDWFRRHHGESGYVPEHPPEADPAVARWGEHYYMVACTLAPFVAVAYSFGFEPSLALLAEHPRVYARLQELFLQHFEPYYEWAARAGYDGGHMVDSWSSADTISPQTYRDWVAPFHRQGARMIQSKGLKADLYSPGNVMLFLPYMRGQGWDAIRIDDLCRGVELDIGEARRILGPDQCLFGNMSAYALLAGDWNDIAARARYQHESAGRSGRLIISNGSGICDKTLPEIVDRWIQYARELGGA